MNGTVEWLVAGMTALAGRLTPPAQREWAAAMRAELSYLPATARLRWAFGTLIAAIKLRFQPMQTGTFRINRWIMLIEVLGCFGPALLAWWEFTFGPSGLVRLNAEIIDKVYLAPTGGAYVLGFWIGYAVTGLVAPLGLLLGLRYVLSGRGLENRTLGIVLIAAPALLALAAFVVGLLVKSTGGWGTGLQIFMLCTVLPIAGVLHLMYLAKPAGTAPTDARLAAS
jgi:hypothetical protein